MSESSTPGTPGAIIESTASTHYVIDRDGKGEEWLRMIHPAREEVAEFTQVFTMAGTWPTFSDAEEWRIAAVRSGLIREESRTWRVVTESYVQEFGA